MRASVAFLAIIISVASADESSLRSEVKLGFGGWTAQGDKIEKTQRTDGGIVIKITGNVLLWTLNRNGKATVASMDYLESSNSTLTLKGYPLLAEGEGIMIPSSHMDPEYNLTMKDGKITSHHNGEFSGTLGETSRERSATLERIIKFRKETVLKKLGEIQETEQAGSDKPATKAAPKNQPATIPQLASVCSHANKIVVIDNRNQKNEIVFTSTTAKTISSFLDAVTVSTIDERGRCLCAGHYKVKLYRDEQEIHSLNILHGQNVSSALWSSAFIREPEKLLQWLDTRNITEPRRQYEASLAQEQRIAKWKSAMPKSFAPLWDDVVGRTAMTNSLSVADRKLLNETIANEFPDQRERILALFSWYGSIKGSWQGSSTFELAASELLFNFPSSDLVSTAQIKTLSNAQLEGAARFFGSGEYGLRRPEDLKQLPATLKTKLLSHSLKSGDKYNRQLAKTAFSK